MENKQQKSAEDRLREIAQGLGMTMRDFQQLFNQAYIEDEKIRGRLIERQNQEIQMMQNQLASLQYRNESMQNQLLTYKLERRVKWMNLRKKMEGWFVKSKPVSK